MTDTAREITPITFLNDGDLKSTIRDFSPHVQAVERRLEVVPEPSVEEVLATVEPPVLTPEEEEALAAEAAAEAELAAGTTELPPDPTLPPVAASDTPEASEQTEAQPVPPSTRVTKKLPPAPA